MLTLNNSTLLSNSLNIKNNYVTFNNKNKFTVNNYTFEIKNNNFEEVNINKNIKNNIDLYQNLYKDLYNKLYNDINVVTHVFHIFLKDMNFKENDLYDVDFNLSFSKYNELSDNKKLDFVENKKLIKEILKEIHFNTTNLTLITSSNSDIYIDKNNNILYKEFDTYSVLNMINEAFIQYILHNMISSHIPKVYALYKNIRYKNNKYILVEKFIKDGTLYDNYLLFNKNDLLNILIKICNIIEFLQKNIDFLHNDLKMNNICVNLSNNQVYLIDFGYSSLTYNNIFVSGDFTMRLDDFCKNNDFKEYTYKFIMKHNHISLNKYKYSSDLFYLIYTILYYYKSDVNIIYDILYPLFNVKNINNENINIFDILVELEEKSFEHIAFFISKSDEMFGYYFDNIINNNIQEELFQRFLPQNLNIYLNTFF